MTMTNLDTLLPKWEQATANLKWGHQRVFHDVFTLAANGQTHLIYGSDYRGNYPCLVNTVGTMLTVGGGQGIPSANFPEIVSLFDRINLVLADKGVNTEPGMVSPLAAEVFLHHFAPLKDAPESSEIAERTPDTPYVEPTDEEMAASIAQMFTMEAPAEITLDENDFTNFSLEAITSDSNLHE